jgi:hypothetical protein
MFAEPVPVERPKPGSGRGAGPVKTGRRKTGLWLVSAVVNFE